jgi:flagellar biosynthetic protein FliP
MSRLVPAGLVALGLAVALGASPPVSRRPTRDPAVAPTVIVNRPAPAVEPEAAPASTPPPSPARTPQTLPATTATGPAPASPPVGTPIHVDQLIRSVSTFALVGAVSLAPAAVLMLTAFVRINVVLVLLRQALGSPQVPGNQVLTALALLLTALVMRPVGEEVYSRALAPYANGTITWTEAYRQGSRPVKSWMLEQIGQTRHQHYLWAVYDRSAAPGQADPQYEDEFPLGVVATAFLLSELTTALVMGFYLYLPFLVVDLVVSSVLAAMGLFMLPPSLVALPLKLILFVLVDGWLHVATMLLKSFGTAPA